MSGSGIHIKKSHIGALHDSLGIKPGEPISMGTLMKAKVKAKKTGNSLLMKRATFAANAKGWDHSRGYASTGAGGPG